MTRTIYRIARIARDLKAISRAASTGSPTPIVKRAVNKWIGRHIVRRLWWR